MSTQTLKHSHEEIILASYGFIFIITIFLTFLFFRYYLTQYKTATTASTLIKLCQKNPKSQNCYGNEIRKIAQQNDIDTTIGILRTVQQIDPQTRYCHFIAHQIAWTEVKKNPKNWLNIFQDIDLNMCSRGFFHGAIEGYLWSNSSFMLDKNSISSICDQIDGYTKNRITPGGTNTCAHTIGHILLVTTKGVVDPAIQICSVTSSNRQFDCMLGVFMENSNKQNLTMHGISNTSHENNKNILQTKEHCLKYSSLAGRACWQIMGEEFSQAARSDYHKLYQLCNQAPDLLNKNNCYATGAGFMTFKLVSGKIPSFDMARVCSPLLNKSRELDNCIQKVVGYVINSSPSYADKLQPFCKAWSKNHAIFCFGQAIKTLRRISPENISYFCREIPSEYQYLCKNISFNSS